MSNILETLGELAESWHHLQLHGQIKSLQEDRAGTESLLAARREELRAAKLEGLRLARLCVKMIGHIRQSQNLTEPDLKALLGAEYDEIVVLIKSFKQKCPSCGCNAGENFRRCIFCGYARPDADVR